MPHTGGRSLLAKQKTGDAAPGDERDGPSARFVVWAVGRTRQRQKVKSGDRGLKGDNGTYENGSNTPIYGKMWVLQDVDPDKDEVSPASCVTWHDNYRGVGRQRWAIQNGVGSSLKRDEQDLEGEKAVNRARGDGGEGRRESVACEGEDEASWGVGSAGTTAPLGRNGSVPRLQRMHTLHRQKGFEGFCPS
jgi:hypothetical protein